MEPEAGDELIVEADDSGRGARVGTILAVNDGDGHATFLVHWVTGDYDALISPSSRVHVRHREHQPGTNTTGPRH
jgi:Domain of unknown function (DUF1918)